MTKTDGYVTIRLPEELIQEVEKLIRDKKELGYKSKAEFIKEAVRQKIIELKKIK